MAASIPARWAAMARSRRRSRSHSRTTLAAELERRGHVRVALTRDPDTFVSLPDRVRFARERKATLFVSIHADTLTATPCSGRNGLHLGRPCERRGSRPGRREGEHGRSAGRSRIPREEDEEVVSILDDLMRRETRVLSVAFAQKLVQSLGPHVRLNKIPAVGGVHGASGPGCPFGAGLSSDTSRAMPIAPRSHRSNGSEGTARWIARLSKDVSQ